MEYGQNKDFDKLWEKEKWEFAKESIHNHKDGQNDDSVTHLYLRIIAESLKHKKPIRDDEIREFFCNALLEIAQGKDPKEALLLKLKKQPRVSFLSIAYQVCISMKRGLSQNKAIKKIAYIHDISEDYIRKDILPTYKDLFAEVTGDIIDLSELAREETFRDLLVKRYSTPEERKKKEIRGKYLMQKQGIVTKKVVINK